MAAFRATLSLCGVLFLLSQPANAQANEQVGKLGDLKKLEIRGSTTFAADNIKDPLWRSLDIQAGAHPKSILSNYLLTLEDKVTEGYRYAGFWDARVKAEADRKAGRCVVTVVEGQRLTAGEVRVEGAKSIVVADLVRRLTSRRPKQKQDAATQNPAATMAEEVKDPMRELSNSEETDPPVWEQGKPARLDRESKKTRAKDIKDALADLGYLSARFFDDVVRDPKGNTVSLLIRLHDEGVQTVLGEIDIVGNERNSRQEIIDYLQLKPGMPLSREVCDRLKRRLWASGRFTKCDVELAPAFRLSEKRRINIDLREYPKASRLGEPLSPVEQAMLKCRDCLMDPSSWPGDLVCRAPSLGTSFVLSPKRGAIVALHGPIGPGKTPTLDHAIAATGDEVGFYNVPTGRKYAFAPNGKQVILNLIMKYCDDPESLRDDQPFRIMFGAGLNSDDKKGRLMPVRLNLTMEPVVFIALAHEHEPKSSIADGVMTLRTKTDLWRIDVKSGRLLEWSLLGKEKGEKEESGKMLVAFEQGEFDRQFAEIRKTAAGHANAFDSKLPFASAGKFLASDDAYWVKLALKLCGNDDTKKVDPQTLQVACKLLGVGVLAPLDAIDWNAWADDDNKFKLREDQGFAQHGFMGVAAQLVLSASDTVFPRDSWPWTLTRETALSVVGKGQHSQEEMYDLYSSADSGPLCCLMAGTLNLWNNPPMARKFAAKGLKKLDVNDFRKDYRFLLQPNHPIAKQVNAVGAVLRELSDEDVAVMMKKASPQQRQFVMAGIRILRERKDRPAIEALPEVFDAVWKSGLRDTVKGALVQLESGCVPWQKSDVATKPTSPPR